MLFRASFSRCEDVASGASRKVKLGTRPGGFRSLRLHLPTPEASRKLAGGKARNERHPRIRIKRETAPDGAAEISRVTIPSAPAGAHDLWAARSGGSRSLRSLHHRLISVVPMGHTRNGLPDNQCLLKRAFMASRLTDLRGLQCRSHSEGLGFCYRAMRSHRPTSAGMRPLQLRADPCGG